MTVGRINNIGTLEKELLAKGHHFCEHSYDIINPVSYTHLDVYKRQALERAKGGAKIGTTGKGIGPTYTDKVSRNGLRLGDLFHNFDAKYSACLLYTSRCV